MCRSAVMLATSSSALVFAYSRCRTCPGCTTSNTLWHMITLFARGRGPRICRSSSAVLILCRYFSVSDESMALALAEVMEPGPRGLGDRLRIPERGAFPVVDVRDDLRDPFLEAHFGLPAKLGRDLADVRVGALGFAGPLRNVDFLAAQELDQAVGRLRIARPEGPDPAC